MTKFTCSIVWQGSGDTAVIEDREIEVEIDPKDWHPSATARKKLTKELKGQGLMEGKDFTITLIEPENADEPPPPFVCGPDW